MGWGDRCWSFHEVIDMSANKLDRQKPRGHPHLSPLEVQAITNALGNGVSATSLARQFGVSRQTIYNAAKATNEKRVVAPREGAPLPQKRQRAKRITPAIRKVVCDWKKQYPAWGVGFLQRELVMAGYAPISSPSIYKILQEAGLSSRTKAEDKAFHRFSMTRPGQLYQADIQGRVVLPGLGAIHGVAVLDDYSRYCPAFLYFQDEKLSNAIIALNLAIQRHGVPVEGFQMPRMYGIPTNRPELGAWIAAAGFKEDAPYACVDATNTPAWESAGTGLARSFQLVNLSPSEWGARREEIEGLVTGSFSDLLPDFAAGRFEEVLGTTTAHPDGKYYWPAALDGAGHLAGALVCIPNL